KLEAVAYLGGGAKIVEKRCPGHWRRQEAMHHEHGYLAALVWFEHVDARSLLELIRPEETRIWNVEFGMREKVCQRRGEVGLQRNRPSLHLDLLHRQRVVQLEPATVAGTQLGQASVETEKCAYGKIDGMRIVRMCRAGSCRISRTDQRYAEAIAVV